MSSSSAFNRVIVLVDMDCFYVQVEQRREPSLKGKPCAVVQYTRYQGGGIIAVGYEARSCGVTRGMWGDAAKELCPDIHLFRVPEANGKANLDRYRDAGAEVINVLSQFGGRVERVSIDEAYIDLTDVVEKILKKKNESEYLTSEKLQNTHIVGWPEEYKEGEDKETQRFEGMEKWLDMILSDNSAIEDVKLTIAGAITEEIRAAVYHQTGFRCSAGICHNKMLSKFSCGIHKPNKQSVLPKTSIPILFNTLKIGKVRNLGGKLGKSLVEKFNINFMSEIKNIPIAKLVDAYGHKSAYWLHEVSKGIDNELVKERHVAQSIGCGKNFLGPDILNTKTKVKTWMSTLLIELSERLDKDKFANSRIAKSLTVHLKLETGKSLSRSAPLLKYGREELLKQCMQLIRPLDTSSSNEERWYPGIINLSINAKKFDTFEGSMFKHTTSPSKIKQRTIIESTPVFSQAPSTSITQPSTSNSVSCSDNNVKNRVFSGDAGLETIANSDIVLKNETPSHTSDDQKFGKEILIEKNINNISHFLKKVTPEKLLEKPIKIDDDVIFIESQKPQTQQQRKSFFDSVKKSSNKTSSLCKIDAMFMKENNEQNTVDSLPNGPIIHPLFGEIDKEVFKDLPLDIQSEITRSYKITSSVIQSSQSPKQPLSQQTTKVKDRNQKLISNFISSSAKSSDKFTTPTSTTGKRRSSGPSPVSSKKQKIKSPASRKSPGNKPKKLTFSSKTNDDSVPLGFFRQRSQLNNAISKALTKKPSKFNMQ